jgi:hypothetical protein
LWMWSLIQRLRGIIYDSWNLFEDQTKKNKWHLVSLAISAEAANLELETFKKRAVDDGNERAEVAVQVFDSLFWIPEYMTEIKEQKPSFN